MRHLQRVVNLFNPVSFARSLGFEPDEQQQEFLMSNSTRQMLCCTRQWGKSTITALKAYFLTKNEVGLGVIVSPSERQSKELMLKIKEFYSADIDSFDYDGQASKTEVRFKNGSRIVALPANLNTIRGYSAPKWLLFDEAAMCPDDVYFGVLPMIATTPNSKVFLISSPKGKRGFFWNEWNEGEGWHKQMVKATDVDRIPQAFLDEQLKRVGKKWFAQEYLCEFLNVNDNLFDMGELANAFGSRAPVMEQEKKLDIGFDRMPTLSERYTWLNSLR